MSEIVHLTAEELNAGLDHIKQSPRDKGTLELIVRRPQVDEREVLEVGELDPVHGLVGDNWGERASADNPDTQLNIMNARCVALIAQDPDRRALAGDQLYVDLDLSDENLPPGSQLSIGDAIVQISEIPHTGCKKFAQRFGVDAVKFVNTGEGKALHLRGVNARVVKAGTIKAGDKVRKV